MLIVSLCAKEFKINALKHDLTNIGFMWKKYLMN